MRWTRCKLFFVYSFFTFLVSADFSEAQVRESLFEEFVRANGGSIPWPPGDLLHQMDVYFARQDHREPDDRDSPDLALVVPNGRSLQNHCTDETHPRIITFSDPYRGSIWLAFSELCGSAEVISWNPNPPGQHDFLVIENYGPSQQARLRQTHTNECIDCHQNRGPILPRFPAREINSPSAMEAFFSRLDRENSNNRYLGINFEAVREASGRDSAFNESQPLDCGDLCGNFGRRLVETQDFLLRKSSARSRAPALCERACGSVPACLIFAAQSAILGAKNQFATHVDPITHIRTPAFNSFFEQRLATTEAQLRSSWPQDNFALPSSILLDRDPRTNTLFMAVPPDVTPIATEDPSWLAWSLRNAKGNSREVVLWQRELGAPSSVRANDQGISPEIGARLIADGACFDISGEDLYQISLFPKELTLSLIAHSPAIHHLLARRPLVSGEELAARILSLLGTKNPLETICPVIPPNRSPEGSQLGQLSRIADFIESRPTAEQLFVRHCNECHHAGSSWPQPLPLTDVAALKNYQSTGYYIGESVLSLLEDGTMPRHSPFTEKLSAEDRQIMLDAIRAIRRAGRHSAD